MATVIPFTPTTNSLFQFQPTLDGTPYTATIVWNLWGRRWYLSLTDVSGNQVVYIPFVGSPPDYDANLVAGYFTTSSLVYRIENGNIEVSP